jgi:hypothetical protein
MTVPLSKPRRDFAVPTEYSRDSSCCTGIEQVTLYFKSFLNKWPISLPASNRAFVFSLRYRYLSFRAVSSTLISSVQTIMTRLIQFQSLLSFWNNLEIYSEQNLQCNGRKKPLCFISFSVLHIVVKRLHIRDLNISSNCCNISNWTRNFTTVLTCYSIYWGLYITTVSTATLKALKKTHPLALAVTITHNTPEI